MNTLKHRRLIRTKWLLATFCLIVIQIQAQDLSGCWQGVEYNPKTAISTYWPSLFCFSQSGNTLTGSLYQIAGSNPIYFVEYEMTGSFSAGVMRIQHGRVIKANPFGGWCYGNMTMTYDPVEEKLTGESTYTVATCNGTIELYRIALKSPAVYCKGQLVSLRITGKAVKWYADPQTKTLVNQGNTFAPNIAQTTTYYVTQTHYGRESPAVPIKIEIIAPPALTSLVKDAACGQSTGVISVSATGGSQTQYSLNNGAWQSAPEFRDLQPGTYTIQAKDATGCLSTKDVVIGQQDAPKINLVVPQQPQCGTANGSIVITATGGNGSLSYSLDGATFKTTNRFDNLASGNYTVTVKDQNQCTVSQAISLNKTVNLQMKELTVVPTTCGNENGSVTISSNEGNGPVQYAIDGTNYQASGIFNNLKAGTYSASVKDEAGCIDSRTVTITASSGPKIDQISTEPTSCGAAAGRLMVQASGQGNISYAINGGMFQAFSSFTGLTQGTYELSVRDSQNCSLKRTVTITEDCQSNVYLPEAFTPNGDGENDSLVIKSNLSGPIKLTIFNRWGEIIFQTENAKGQYWDGTYKGEIAQGGLFGYIIQFQDINGQKFIKGGTVQIIR